MSSSANLKNFITHQLNTLYCSSSHIVERLPEIADEPGFLYIKFALSEAVEEAELFIGKLDGIYKALKTEYHFDDCGDLITSLENSFHEIQQHIGDVIVRDLELLNYISAISSTRSAIIRLLNLAARHTPELSISSLLTPLTETAFNFGSLKPLLTDRLLKTDLVNS